MKTRSLYLIAENNNIPVDFLSLKACDSLSLRDSDGSASIVIDFRYAASLLSEQELLSHELGHCMTGSFYNQYSALDLICKHEYRANKWSVHKLLPIDDLMEALAAGCTEVWELADRFDVTEDFIRIAIDIYEREGVFQNPYE